MSYQDNLNGIALKGVLKPIYQPDPTLAIAEAENYAPIGILTTRTVKPSERLYTQVNTNSYSGVGGRGPIKQDTQEKEFYIGEGVEY